MGEWDSWEAVGGGPGEEGARRRRQARGGSAGIRAPGERPGEGAEGIEDVDGETWRLRLQRVAVGDRGAAAGDGGRGGCSCVLFFPACRLLPIHTAPPTALPSSCLPTAQPPLPPLTVPHHRSPRNR